MYLGRRSSRCSRLEGLLRGGCGCVHGSCALQSGRCIQRLHGSQSRRLECLCGTACKPQYNIRQDLLAVPGSPAAGRTPDDFTYASCFPSKAIVHALFLANPFVPGQVWGAHCLSYTGLFKLRVKPIRTRIFLVLAVLQGKCYSTFDQE